MTENPERKSERIGRGYCGKICMVDLTSGKIEMEDVGDAFYEKYLSGVGLGAKVLWDRIKPGIDPMGPDNVLGFTTGLLTGTGTLFTGRFTVVAKSPATGGWGDANCGGYFSPFLKKCGVDGLFFQGASDRPVYLYINENGAELKDASDLWGKDTIETERELKQRHGKSAQVASIGPAGEKRSFIAGIATDRGRYAGRGGLGGVMGSKKLKAVVAHGKLHVGVALPDRMKELTQRFRKRLRAMESGQALLGDGVGTALGYLSGKPFYTRQPALAMKLILMRYGTPGFVSLCTENGDAPAKNWLGVARPDFPRKKYLEIAGRAVTSFQMKKYGCYACPIRCGGEVNVTEGPYQVGKTHKPEYETIVSFGNLSLNHDLHSIFKLNDMVNRGGVDSISCGAVVAFAIECFENNILDTSDTGGLELHWGNSEAIVKLTEMIINREGIGDVLADGVKLAAERIGKGSDEFAVHCGGIEAPMHDPKFDPGYAMTYLCDPNPGRHTISGTGTLEMQSLEKKFSRAWKPPAFSTRKKRHDFSVQGDGIAVGTFYKMLVDCAGICFFGTQVGGDIPICEWMNAATGWSVSNDEYLIIGERIEQLRHAFNVREGLNAAKDFRPHHRVCGDPPLASGPLKDVTMDLDALAESFYTAAKWDLETGRPYPEHLKSLDLTEVIEELYPDEGG